MPDPDLLANRPLARAAIWILVDAGIVLAVGCGLMLRPDLAPDLFDHEPLRLAGQILFAGLFTLLAATSSALGFLSNCRPGQIVGRAAIAALAFGWIAIVTLFRIG